MVLAYLSGPIIHSHLRKNEFYRAVVDTLEKKGITVFAPQFLEPKTPVEIYRRDVKYIRQADFIVAEVSNPSLGVGMEIMLAILLKKPTLVFHEQKARPISKMVEGAEGKVILEYSTLEEVTGILRTLDLGTLTVHECDNCDSMVAEKSYNGLTCVACGSKLAT